MPTRHGRSTGGCRGKSLRQGMDPAGRHAQDIPRRGGGSAGDSGHGVPMAGHAVKGYPRASRDAASALRKWQLRAVNVVHRRCSGDVTVGMSRCRWAVQGAFRHAGWTDGTPCQSLAAGVGCRSSHASGFLRRDDIIATGGDFGLGGTVVCGDGGDAFALVVASGGDGARIMRIGTMKTEERRCGKPF